MITECKSSHSPVNSKKGRRIRIQKAPSDVASTPKLLLELFFVYFPTPTSGFPHHRRDSALARAEPNRPQIISVLMAIPSSESSTAICMRKLFLLQTLICIMHTAHAFWKNVACSLCSEEIEREVLALHKRESCPQRIVTCEYCEFLLPAVDLSKHQEVCGDRPEYCDLCNKYIRRHELNDHQILLHSNSHYIPESSRNWSIPQREQGVPRRPGCNSSKRCILFTISITGIAILIGSMFIQRRPDSHQ
ncbi:TRAF-type zinc finger domain-containing protein 1 [Cinnamomum micranthum f. kanehirae]|uniref:TRAF-type zinc finger domain-containing protein 1 n=1 Tax=Cinnamomum micranthum f. kanehirae TaxID=337451 RepID=A0A443NXA0_9MAGN|nr:TRAF-type zinc finger domain-containing protein 1 [Cinnamomum micranthum f. kanehirae]